MGESGALVIRGVDDDLGLAGQASKRRRVDDTVPVAFETGAFRIRLLRTSSVPGTTGQGRARAQHLALPLLTLQAPHGVTGSDTWSGVTMGVDDTARTVSSHRGGPLTSAIGDLRHGSILARPPAPAADGRSRDGRAGSDQVPAPKFTYLLPGQS